MLAFDSRPSGHSQLFVMPSTGGAPHSLTSGDSENTVSSWSRDGKWIYFGSNRGGSWQIWKVPPSGGEPVQVTDNGGFAGFESADGHYLYYAKDDAFGLWRRPVSGGEESKVFDGKFSAVHWALGRNGVYFVDSSGGRAGVAYYDLGSHVLARLATLDRPVPPDEAALDVSPDESRVLVMQVMTDMDIMLVENFR
jgi:Tol biopolymer transport system component